MLKFGFEREFFVRKGRANPPGIVPKGVPHDMRLLAEARGKPYTSASEAAYSLAHEVYRLQQLLAGKLQSEVPKGWRLDLKSDVAHIPPNVVLNARRTESKGPVHEGNLYGHLAHAQPEGEWTAGLHISITREQTLRSTKCSATCNCGNQSISYNGVFDFAAFVRIMDEEFAEEIRNAQRNPGFYEIKPDGRVEYRSLPQSLDALKVAEFITRNIKIIHGYW